MVQTPLPSRPARRRRSRGRRAARRAAGLALALLAAACSQGPRSIQYGIEECAQCRMTIAEPRFAAQALSERGRSFGFDAIECAAAFVNAQGPDDVPLRSIWVADHADADRWLHVEDAFFVHSAALRSPMGGGLAAYGDRAAAEAAVRELAAGEVLDWAAVVALVEREGRHGHGHP
jgi:copper chaperone NosL